MAIEFVGGASAGKTGAAFGTSTIALNSGLTGGVASSVSDGDLVIAVFGTGSAANRTLAITDGTTAYTLIGSELYSDDNYDTNLRVAYKFMGGTPDTTTTFGPTGNTSDSGAMAVYVFRGVDSTTPLDVAAVSATGTNTSRADPAGITPTTAGAFPVFVGAAAHNGGVDTFTSGDLTDFQTRGGSNDTNDVTIGIGHIDNWTSGASNPAAFGHTQTDNAAFSWAAMSIALRPAADTIDDLLANDVSSASSVGTPTVGQKHAILANDVASASSVTTAALGQVHALLANDVASASSVSTPALLEVVPLLADDVSSASSVSAPAIGQTHIILGNDVASTSSVSTPVLGQTHALLANDVDSASSVSTPALAQVHALAANDNTSASSVSVPALGQIHAILANDVASASSVGTPALAEVAAGTDVLLANDVSSASSVGTPAVGQTHALLANDVSSASSVSAPVLTVIGGTTAVTVAGGRISAATSYSYRTIGSINREKGRELAKIARRAQRKVAAVLDTEPSLSLADLVRQEVTATAPKRAQWLSPAMLDGIVQSIVDYHRAQWARIQEQEDEEDAEFLLLVA